MKSPQCGMCARCVASAPIVIERSCGFHASLSSATRAKQLPRRPHLVIELREHTVFHRHKALPGPSVVLTALAAAVLVAHGCARRDGRLRPPLVAQVTGTLPVEGLEAPVTRRPRSTGASRTFTRRRRTISSSRRDSCRRRTACSRWISGAARRRAVCRRSSGPNFIERDAMTRRIQYGGDLTSSGRRYGADAEGHRRPRSCAASTRGWPAPARMPPEPFVLAGWLPEPWSADDLLNRTDAVVENAGVLEDIARAGLGDVVADSIRRAGAPPFFTGPGGSGAVGRSRAGPGGPRASASTAMVPLGKGLRDGRRIDPRVRRIVGPFRAPVRALPRAPRRRRLECGRRDVSLASRRRRRTQRAVWRGRLRRQAPGRRRFVPSPTRRR